MQLQPGRLNQSMLCMNIIDTTCACLRLHSAFGCANTNYIHIHTQLEPEYVYVYDVRLYVTIRALWTSSRKTSALFTFVSLYVMWCACLLDSIHGKRYVHFSNLILFFLSFSLSFFHFVALVRMRTAETPFVARSVLGCWHFFFLPKQYLLIKYMHSTGTIFLPLE